MAFFENANYQIPYSSVEHIHFNKEGLIVYSLSAYTDCIDSYVVNLIGPDAQRFYDEFKAAFDASNYLETSEKIINLGSVLSAWYAPDTTSPAFCQICTKSNRTPNVILRGSDASAFKAAYDAFTPGSSTTDFPPIYLKYEPQSQLRSGTGGGYDSPNMYWNEPAMVLHAFGPEYTRLQVFFAMAMQGDINSQWEIYCRDFDSTSTNAQNSAAQSPVPGSLFPLSGPHPAAQTLFFPATPEFDCIPGRAFNFGARRLSGPNASIRMIAATYKFSAP